MNTIIWFLSNTLKKMRYCMFTVIQAICFTAARSACKRAVKCSSVVYMMRLKARLDNQSTFEVIRESGSRGKTRFLFNFKSIETKSFIQRLFTSAEGVCFLNYSSFNEQFVRKQMSSLRGRRAAGLLPLSKRDGSESPRNGTKTAAFYL